MITVQDFLGVYKNPENTVNIKDESDTPIAKLYAEGDDVINATLGARTIRLIKHDDARSVTITVTNA